MSNGHVYRWIESPQVSAYARAGNPLEMKMNQRIRKHVFDQPFEVGLLGIPLSRSSISASAASEFPQALRLAWKYFATYNIDLDVDLNDLAIVDLGDIRMHMTDVFQCHQNIEAGIQEVLSVNPPFLPILIGGDHSVTCPLVQGIQKHFGNGSIGIIQFDTHFDLRDPGIWGAANGTPIRGLIESGAVKGEHVVNIGLHGYYNTYSLKQFADEHKVKYVTLREVRKKGIEQVVLEAIGYPTKQVERIYITVDMDVLDMAFAPGVPASTPGGLYSWELFEALYLLGKQERVCAMDIVELDPNRDHQQLITVKTGAHLILNFLCGYKGRGKKETF